ncbi:MARVEL domain-containing protein [Caenorhabditis elegans]|uniref:MARVEL domain-containing protein n=1 Tax=Caenorhabditis elegans TaxID=6239 RepID=Q95XJ6_CAEEL|nr:MARVEL domain-containing protein [Caenorhabditis elegans]CCD71586.1 MARVEL domain-containing protein [Caenorhabditis elegans]|eukprot:NP_508378.1 Uncharacterized protein CELE_Y102A11A.1 [Caenorhabditis elegans]
MTKYIRVKESYCGCISVQYFAIIASCITLAFQLTFSIFFLIYGQLWGLIPMALTIASHLFFMIVILQFKSTISITIYSGIEIAFSFVILGFSIWILSFILDPKVSFVYNFCATKLLYTSCYGGTQLVSLIWGCIFIIFFFASVLLLPVFRTTWRNIKVTRKSSSVYIDGDNAPVPPVQPIFNINSGPPAAQPAPQQIMIPPQLFNQQMPQLQNPQQHNQISQQTQSQMLQPQRPQQLYPASSAIMQPSGVIHLNLYTIQLPNGHQTYTTSSPIIDQLSSNYLDSVSQTEQIIEERL